MLTATFFAFTCFCMLSDPYCTTFNMHAAMRKTQSNVFNLEDGVAEGETTTIQDPALQKLDESLNGVITEFIGTAEFSGKAVRTLLSVFVCNNSKCLPFLPLGTNLTERLLGVNTS